MNAIDVYETPQGIPERAVMECFYGPLWDARSRATVMGWGALHGSTDYVYGPAADLHTGSGWREPLTVGHANELAGVVDSAHGVGLSVTWRVSPGAPMQRDRAMRLGDDEELALLKAHADEVLALGFDRVLIAFDDIDGTMDPVSRSRFGGAHHPLAAAQTYVLNAMDEHLRNAGSSLLACPTRYWGSGPSEYRQRFGELLAADVPVCWTGPRVVSPVIRGQEAASVREQYQHNLWLWDNYPVNDWDASGGLAESTLRPRRLPLRPLAGREASVAQAVVGYGANAALLPYSGFPALATALEWARTPAGYDPAASHRRALERMTSVPEALALMAEASGVNAGGSTEASALQRAAAAVLASGSPDPQAFEHLRKVARKHLDAAGQLRASADAICREIEPWVAELARAARAASHAADVLQYLDGPDERALDLAVAAFRDIPGPSRDITLAVGAVNALVDHVRGAAGVGIGSLTEDV